MLSRTSHARGPRLEPTIWAVLVIGILGLGFLVHSDRLWRSNLARDVVLLDNVLAMESHLALGYVWLQELLTGGAEAKTDEVRRLFDGALERARAATRGDSQVPHIAGKPPTDADLLQQLQRLELVVQRVQEVADQRLQAPERGGIGTPLHRQFDAAFAEARELASKIDLRSRQQLSQTARRQDRIRMSLIAIWITVVVGSGAALQIFGRGRRRSAETLRASRETLKLRNRIDQAFLTATDESMYGEVLQIILEATHSPCGVLGFISEKGDLVAPSMTRGIWDRCQIPDKSIVFPRAAWGGIWGRSLIEGKTFYSNTPLEVPKSHIPVARAVSTPIVHHGTVIGIIVVANRLESYEERDIMLLEDIAAYVASVLNARLQRDQEESECTLAEEELASAMSFLDTVVDMSPFAMWVADPDGTIIRTNRSLRETLNLTDEQIIGKYNVLGDANLQIQGVMPRVKGVFEKHEPARFSIPWTAMEAGDVAFKGARDLYIDVSMFPVLNSEGALSHVVCQWVDITERREAEEALRESEARLRQVAETIEDVFWITTWEDHRTVFASPAYEKIWGRTRRQLYENPADWADAIHPEDRGRAWERFLGLEHDQAYDEEYRIVRPDGTVRWVRDRGFPVRSEAGAVERVVGVAQDITERKEAQRGAQEAQEQLVEQQRREKERVEEELARVRDELVRQTRLATIGQVSASIAHELRNPLGAVRNASYLLRRRAAEDDPQRSSYLDMIDQEIAASDRIIRNLLEMSRPKLPVKQLASLRQTLQATFENPAFGGVPWRLTAQPEPFTIWADPAQFGQVLSNLIANATQAIGEKGEISVDACRSQDYDEITISDCGPGVKHQDRSRLFEPLFSTKAKGTGLGLAICRQIIEGHGGTIEFAGPADEGSPANPGARFRIRLPRPPA